MVEVGKRGNSDVGDRHRDPPPQPAFDVLTTSFLHRFPILKSSFDRTKIARIAIIRMLLDGGPCSCKSAASSRAYCIFCENFSKCVGEFPIKYRNVGTFTHEPSPTLLIDAVRQPTLPAAPSRPSDRACRTPP